MDKATVIGIVVGSVILAGAILLGRSAMLFVDFPSLILVAGGTVAVAIIRFSLTDVSNSLKVVLNTFLVKINNHAEIIQEIVSLANISRKNGLIVLEQQPIKDPFLKKAVMYCVDGHEAEFIEEVLRKEAALAVERHDVGQRLFKRMGDVAPAFGMIGTLVGLVQMLAGMGDPQTLGPSMATALLATLYGAVLANLLFIPLADKLAQRSQEEARNRKLIIEGVLGILKGLNPRAMEEFLECFLPQKFGASRKIVSLVSSGGVDND